MSETEKKNFPLFSFVAITIFVRVHKFCPLGRMESPLISHSYQGETFPSPKRIALAKACPYHRCEANILGKLADDFSMLYKASQNDHFSKSLAKSEARDQNQSGKIPKIIEHVSYSIRYRKYHCSYAKGAIACEMPGFFIDSPGIYILILLSCMV